MVSFTRNSLAPFAALLFAASTIAACTFSGGHSGVAPPPSVLPPGVVACASSGTGAIAVLCIGSKTYAFVGKGTVSLSDTFVEQIDISSGAAAAATIARAPAGAHFHRDTASVFHTYTLDFPATECSSDESTLTVFCGSFFSSKIADIDASTNTDTEFDTGATGSLGFSGGSCTICAIAFDPIDHGFIIEDPNPGGSGCPSQCGQFQLVPEAAPHTIVKSIATGDPNENPGYDYVADRIFNPGYGTDVLQIADFTNGKLFSTTSSIANMAVPDSACVDVTTHVGETGNEFTPPDVVTVADLGTATESGTTLTITTGQTTLVHSGDQSLDDDACATDSVLHVTFFAGEFGTSLLGFALLPATSTGTTISDWAFAAFPNTPDGARWSSAFDPHPITAFNSPANCLDCAISVNGPFTWMAVVDLNKLIHAPRSATDPHSISPTFDLQANGVLKFYAI